MTVSVSSRDEHQVIARTRLIHRIRLDEKTRPVPDLPGAGAYAPFHVLDKPHRFEAGDGIVEAHEIEGGQIFENNEGTFMALSFLNWTHRF